MDPDRIRAFFAQYASVFNRSLAGQADLSEVTALYATEVIAASPAGVRAGRNDASLKEAMDQGYERYRAMGTQAMSVRHVRTCPIDEGHALAHVAWTATYAREGLPNVAIDFEVHYLLQERDGEITVFGWVSGDEEAVLRQHGIV